MTMKTQNEREESVKAHIKAIVNELNSMGLDDKKIAAVISETIGAEHRTLQQAFFRVIQHTMVHYGRYAHVDQRNEVSRDWCNQVADIQTTIPVI